MEWKYNIFVSNVVLTQYRICLGHYRDDLTSLPFTTMFIKESLRFHAPVPGIGRALIKDVKFPDGTLLPKGIVRSKSPICYFFYTKLHEQI